jgi:hypothetical protein
MGVGCSALGRGARQAETACPHDISRRGGPDIDSSHMVKSFDVNDECTCSNELNMFEKYKNHSRSIWFSILSSRPFCNLN